MALEPLSLSNSKDEDLPSISRVLGLDTPSPCPGKRCTRTFLMDAEEKIMLQHLFIEHKLVIADFDRIALYDDYLRFWKEKFEEKPLAEYCTTMHADTKIDNTVVKNQEYFLLSDVLPVDYQLRKDLQQKRLQSVLEHQKLERNDQAYERECLFCRTILKGTRTAFLQHLFEKHNFYVAKLENLVFTADLIEILNKKLVDNICIYCEKVFKDRVILKEHMRKKAHKKINPKNKEYDKFFISNYLEMGKNWQSYLKNVENCAKKPPKKIEKDAPKKDELESSSESDNNWSDWDEKEDLAIVCLFCKHSRNQYAEILSHMSDVHNFDFRNLTKEFGYYEKLKIVNFIRRQIFLSKCIKCNEQSPNYEALLSHMAAEKHFTIDDSKCWNQPEYYFPTYEDDGFLYFLEDNDEIEEIDDKVSMKDGITVCDTDEPGHISQEVALSVISS